MWSMGGGAAQLKEWLPGIQWPRSSLSHQQRRSGDVGVTTHSKRAVAAVHAISRRCRANDLGRLGRGVGDGGGEGRLVALLLEYRLAVGPDPVANEADDGCAGGGGGGGVGRAKGGGRRKEASGGGRRNKQTERGMCYDALKLRMMLSVTIHPEEEQHGVAWHFTT